MNDYLPQDTASTLALDKMHEEFSGEIPNARVMLNDVSVPEVLEYKEKIKQVAGVEEVTWLDNVVNIAQPLDSFDKKTVETYYQEKYALLTLTITEDKNIRETVAFPLNQNGEDVLTGTPNEVTELQLRETHIKLR